MLLTVRGSAKPLGSVVAVSDFGVAPGFPDVPLFASGSFRPPQYLEPCPSPTKRLGSTRVGRLPARRPLPGSGEAAISTVPEPLPLAVWRSTQTGGARGSRCPRQCRGRARGQGRTGRTQRRSQLKAQWPVDRDKTLSRFCPAWKSKNFVSRARNTPLRSLFLSAWEAKGSWSCTARPAGLDFPRSALQPCSGCRNTWERLQAQGNAQEVPERTVVLGGDRFRGGWGVHRVLSGRGGYYRCVVRRGDMDLMAGSPP
jgi:hypothetical protein